MEYALDLFEKNYAMSLESVKFHKLLKNNSFFKFSTKSQMAIWNLFNVKNNDYINVVIL